MFNHLSPDDVHAILSSVDHGDLTVTLEREVRDGRTEIFRGSLGLLDEETVTLRAEPGGEEEDVPLTEVVRLSIER
ncbi:MAG: hypothetical protein M3134_05175 [Actinomycetota bacterium]|nr:hypothetical protein [Actinomycetota bacterium]